jgi:hypothetical protein
MENQNIIIETGALVKRDFELSDAIDNLTEEELLAALSEHLAYMLESQLESLLSTLYRMDVIEAKIQKALRPDAPEPANLGIARLIIARQKQRVITKLTYKQKQTTDWFDF